MVEIKKNFVTFLKNGRKMLKTIKRMNSNALEKIYFKKALGVKFLFLMFLSTHYKTAIEGCSSKIGVLPIFNKLWKVILKLHV